MSLHKLQAEKEAKHSRKRCKITRNEQLSISKRTKAATEKHVRLTEEAEAAMSAISDNRNKVNKTDIVKSIEIINKKKNESPVNSTENLYR